eukprot:GSMAST32.ASY1.ANO1.759.1 assembled CDS
MCAEMEFEKARCHTICNSSYPRKNIKPKIYTSKITFMDLAGSEQNPKGTKQRGGHFNFTPLKSVNLSISALQNCILHTTSTHREQIPFRDSKLTRLLQDTLQGNNNTAFVITVSPDVNDASETLRTLEFGQKAKQIASLPKLHVTVDYQSLYEGLQKKVDIAETVSRKIEIKFSKAQQFISEMKERSETLESKLIDQQNRTQLAEERVQKLEDIVSNFEKGKNNSRGVFSLTGIGKSNQTMREVKKIWSDEKSSILENHNIVVNQIRRQAEENEAKANARAEDAIAEYNHLDFELKQEKQEHLETLQEFSRTRLQLLEQEKDKDARVGALLEEIKKLQTELNKCNGIAEKMEEAEEMRQNDILEIKNRVLKDYVGRDKINEMETLYNEVIEKLEERVEKIEKIKTRKRTDGGIRANRVKSRTSSKNTRTSVRDTNNSRTFNRRKVANNYNTRQKKSNHNHIGIIRSRRHNSRGSDKKPVRKEAISHISRAKQAAARRASAIADRRAKLASAAARRQQRRNKHRNSSSEVSSRVSKSFYSKREKPKGRKTAWGAQQQMYNSKRFGLR